MLRAYRSCSVKCAMCKCFQMPPPSPFTNLESARDSKTCWCCRTYVRPAYNKIRGWAAHVRHPYRQSQLHACVAAAGATAGAAAPAPHLSLLLLTVNCKPTVSCCNNVVTAGPTRQPSAAPRPLPVCRSSATAIQCEGSRHIATPIQCEGSRSMAAACLPVSAL